MFKFTEEIVPLFWNTYHSSHSFLTWPEEMYQIFLVFRFDKKESEAPKCSKLIRKGTFSSIQQSSANNAIKIWWLTKVAYTFAWIASKKATTKVIISELLMNFPPYAIVGRRRKMADSLLAGDTQELRMILMNKKLTATARHLWKSCSFCPGCSWRPMQSILKCLMSQEKSPSLAKRLSGSLTNSLQRATLIKKWSRIYYQFHWLLMKSW